MIKKISIIGLLISVCFVFSFIETFIPFNFSAIGIKLGFANIVVIFAMYKLGNKEGFVLCIVKIIVSGLTFGNINMLIFSFCGGILSYIFMVLFKKRFSIVGVSVIGAVLHNVGQILCAVVIYSTLAIFTYLPVLLIAGVLTGLLIGSLTNIAIKRIKIK